MKSIISIKLCLFGIFIFVSSLTFSNTIIVQNTGDEGIGSLRQAVRDAVTGDTIRFDESLIASGSATIFLDSSIVYTGKGLIFKGLYNSADTLKLSGSNTNRIFTILQAPRTVIDSMVFFNGYAADVSTDGHKGGAIFIPNGNDTTFINNSLFYDNEALINGGAIHSIDYGGDLHISINNSVFKNNSSGGNGGALYFRADNGDAQLDMYDCQVFNNSSVLDGGGVFLRSDDDNAYLNIENCSFLNNNAATNGGGLFLISGLFSELTMLNSIVENNTCSNGNGAGVYVDGGNVDLIVETSEVKGNENLSTGSFHGGGVYANGSDETNVSINDSEISNNTCLNADRGFGLYAYTENVGLNVAINNSTFDNNSGAGQGALYCATLAGDLNCNFYNTSVTNSMAEGTAGGVYLESTTEIITANFEECVISNNSTLSQGGGVLATSTHLINLTFLDSRIENNTCNTGSGAGILVTGDSVVFKLENSFLNSNHNLGIGNNQGGGAYIGGGNFNTTTIINSELKFNEAHGSGAAMTSRTNGTSGSTEFDIINSTVSNNVGEVNTGAIEVSSVQGDITLNLIKSTFNDNSTQNLGGAIYAYTQQEAEVNITKCTAFGNSAVANGGFIYLDGGTLAELNIKESTIVGNLTNNQGGAVYCYNSNPITTIKNSIISENTGTEQLYIYNSATNGLLGGISNGFNIFSNNQLGALPSDQTNVSAVNINLQPLAFNGGTTKTMLPEVGSVAINAGDPNNISNAQNTSIFGVRDVGAAEYKDCLNAPDVNFVITNSSCGENDGEVNTVITGDSPFIINWNNGADTENISDLVPGTYYLTVVDANNCEVIAVANVQSDQLTLSGDITNNVCSNLTAGEIDLQVTGVATPFVYIWTTGATTQDVTNLSAGQYEVIVTDANDCSSSMSFNVLEPLEFSIGFETINAGCGIDNGEIDLTVLGGTGDHTFDWQNSIGTSIGLTEDLTGLGQGFYTVNVIDENGCSTAGSTQISEIGAPILSVNSVINADCTDNGAIDIDITTGNSISSTIWSNSETTEDITDLAVGSYSVVVEDNNNCTSNLIVQVMPALPEAIEICLVTVDTLTGTNMIVWEKPISTTIDKFIIYRETSVSGQYLALDTVDYNDVSEYTDPTAFPNLRSWRYKISVLNTCGIESELSLAHKTIHCTISAALGGGFNIYWNSYEGFSYSTFEVWRHTNANGWELIQTLSNTNFSLTDDPTNYTGLDYFVSVVPPSICSSTNKAQDHNASRSNKSSRSTGIMQDPTDGIFENSNLFAVYPNPVNSELQIRTNLSGSYSISIFDASGKLVFIKKTSESNTSINLKGLDTGVYIITLISEDGVFNKQIVKN